MTDHVEIRREALAVLLQAAAGFADMCATLTEHSEISTNVDDLMAIRAAVELGRMAVE